MVTKDESDTSVISEEGGGAEALCCQGHKKQDIILKQVSIDSSERDDV